MAVSLKHAFQSAIADGGDTSLVQPSNWNAEHTLTLATARLLGRYTAGTGAAEEVSLGTGLSFSAGALTLGIGSALQAWDADLDSWAAVTRASGFDTFVATPSSANLKTLVTDETGSGALVFANTPTLVTPVLGAATATSINGLTISTSTGTLTIANGKTLTASNTLTFTGTDSSSVAFGAGGTVLYTTNISDTAYASGWDGDTTNAPSKNAVYDKIESLVPTPATATWVMLQVVQTGSNGVAIGANTIHYYPLWISRRTTFSDLAARVGATTDAGKLFALAIYANSAGAPSGTPLAATGDMATDSGVVVTADITGANVTFDPGLYWRAIWTNSTTVTFRVENNMDPISQMLGTTTVTDLISGTNSIGYGYTSAETYTSSGGSPTWPNATTETKTLLTRSAGGLSIPWMAGKVV